MDGIVITHKFLMAAQGGACAYCTREMTHDRGRGNTITRDHIIPKSKGGLTTSENIVGACARCNSLKASMSWEEFFSRYPSPEAIEAAARGTTARERSNQVKSSLRVRPPPVVARPAYDRARKIQEEAAAKALDGRLPAHYLAALERMTVKGQRFDRQTMEWR